jgi:thymidylate synthase (FAD)
MSFLSFRTKDPMSKFPSYPQWEINQVANMLEEHFAELFPLTHEAFNEAGRVSP